MRILQVRFKNLNSLAGEWEIDFTHPAFAADGLFAIVGPTGAGKTTILDAICLALYGRTPRLDRIGKSGNEIMSRKTGECFAEAVFETQAGRFRCHWSQRRARKKPDGELQAPKHEIADADSGRIFETKLRGVAECIESATGMDFDRFTRSMLLAQGGFAAFLQAAPDERAPILEQITGTEIYSRISVRVHERRSDERRRLDELQAELNGMQLLSPEDERELSDALTRNLLAERELAARISLIAQALAWREGIAKLEEELKRLVEADAELANRTQAFAPELERLACADRALELAAEHTALLSLRSEQATDMKFLEECQYSRPALAAALQTAEAESQTVSVRLEACLAERRTTLPIVRKARELDSRIGEWDTLVDATERDIAELAVSLKTLAARQGGDVAELDAERAALDAAAASLTACGEDERLVESLAETRERFSAAKALALQLTARRHEETQAEAVLAEKTRDCEASAAILESERHKLEHAQKTVQNLHAEWLATLEGIDEADRRAGEARLSARRDLLAKALDAARTLAQTRLTRYESERRHATLQGEESRLHRALERQAEKLSGLEKAVELLETQSLLLQRIRDLEEERSQLRDGEPCPLCGALEHPFAAGNIPASDETRTALADARSELKAAHAQSVAWTVELAQTRKDLEQNAKERQDCDQILETANRTLAEICAELPLELLDGSDTASIEKLLALQHETDRLLARERSVLASAEALQRSLATARETLDQAKDALARAQIQAQAAKHGQESARSSVERSRQEAGECLNRLNLTLKGALEGIRAFGFDGLAVEELDAVLQILIARRDRWAMRAEEKARRERAIDSLQTRIALQTAQLGEMEADIGKRRARLADIRGERAAHSGERLALFGDRKPDDEETRLTDAVETARRHFEEAGQAVSAARQALDRLDVAIGRSRQATEERGTRLRAAEESFRARLDAAGFGDEERYRSACLPETERKRLTAEARALSDEKTELAAKTREKCLPLETERQKRLTEESAESLERARTASAEEQKNLQQAIGGIRHKLDDHETLKRRQRERLQAIDAQRREYERWSRLHELIGSADGKKFRNFAQGLTFETMIGHANRQLQKMSDRYLLVRDDSQPLELNVIDTYQAGEIRSAKNLSGGESFIVSLALALGLSGMASQNVRVDSLFLDEGFGTLDEEALETALDTLAGLRQDGKTIGVISHVSALKERIDLQLRVAPHTGGRSRISGPGCRRAGSAE